MVVCISENEACHSMLNVPHLIVTHKAELPVFEIIQQASLLLRICRTTKIVRIRRMYRMLGIFRKGRLARK